MKRIVRDTAIAILAIFLIAACTAKPTEPPTRYDSIVEAGKMTCGTSADYPPYEFVDEAGEFAGFDMGLIREVAKRMGVEIEIRDMSFDTIIASIQEGKIDCAIAAMEGTAERDEKVDFSISYKPIVDAVLVRTDSDITMESIFEAANYIVGCQSGGINARWVTANLVETGKLPRENFFEYERADQMVLDVVAGRIDLMTIQADVAAKLAKEHDVKVVLLTEEMRSGGGTVIIIAEGESELKAKLDEALKAIIADGTREELAEEWEVVIPPE